MASTEQIVAAAEKVGELLPGTNVRFVEQSVGPEAEAAARALGPGEVLVVENLRFSSCEEANDPEFARALAALGARQEHLRAPTHSEPSFKQERPEICRAAAMFPRAVGVHDPVLCVCSPLRRSPET